jgi:hypothetical protein
MRSVLAVLGAVSGLTLAGSAAVIPVTSRAGDLSVTATYKGKGPVDETHEILVFLFDHPTPIATSERLGMQVVTKDGGTARFTAVAADTVYITLVYDEKSNYDGRSGPPPAGAPIGSYAKAGRPVPVKPGPDAKVTVSFDDSRRWGQ